MKVLGLGLKSALSLWNLTSSPRLSSLPRAWFSLLHLVFANRWIYHVHRKRHRIWSHGERINTETSIKDSECRPCVCLPVLSTISSSFSVSWRFINYFLLVGYSPSHLPHSYYPCTTSIHVGYIRQMSSLVWLYLLVVSCNSLQECGSSQEATCLEPQVSLKNTIFAFFYRYTLVSYNNIKKGFKIPHTTIPILNTFYIVSDSLNLSFRFLRLLLDVLFCHPYPRVRSHSCILWPTRTIKRYWIIPHCLVHVHCNACVRIFRCCIYFFYFPSTPN